jgi:hypothetical protein
MRPCPERETLLGFEALFRQNDEWLAALLESQELGRPIATALSGPWALGAMGPWGDGIPLYGFPMDRILVNWKDSREDHVALENLQGNRPG